MEYKDKLIVYTENKNSNEKIYKYLNQIVNLNKNYITVQYINSFERMIMVKLFTRSMKVKFLLVKKNSS